jgi:hypothetical protein
MKQVKGFFNISNTDSDNFNADLKKSINDLQEQNQEVEVQYQVNSFPNGQIVYSALILGRVEV